ncbi:hypothetical protein C4K38_3716 [Pseudomonas chlororaphis subsp. piscium]|uniref:hypothetical protein n=1 Tax=Pseudomonas chlororaphis TaxID=587753 RepID=UPI00087DD48E|nr:hypothetical protein [Pseudomonas chlororaphis]AZC31674.1 hypothetical protein C4K38_3716 [Pseudomonas chlororaphis subsp. piscium]WDG89457.1 hypothetical protein PUP49_19345 [Pseudomonas chlororaphis]SDS85619.1 hypothetical protein SAMN05216585_3669 [Pseudomonas chlororaphis]
MEFIAQILKALPIVATSPYALIGYLITVAAWTWAMHRSVRLKILMARLHELPADERVKVIQLELGEVLPSSISPEQWLRARNHRHFMLAVIVLLGTLAAIATVSINAGVERAKAEALAKAKQDEIDIRQAALTSKRLEFEQRLQDLDQKILEAEMEYRQGAAGFMYAPPEQKEIGLAIMEAASAKIKKLKVDKVSIQAKIDELPLH